MRISSIIFRLQKYKKVLNQCKETIIIFSEIFYNKPHQQRHLRHQNYRHAVAELLMLGLMVPHVHPQPRADAAADRRHPQQYTFWNPPPLPLRLPFVDAVEEEGEDVDNYEVKDNDCGNWSIIHNLLTILRTKIPYFRPLFKTTSITNKAQTEPSKQQNISDWVSQM